MKRTIISILALSALVGCSKSGDEPGNQGTASDKTPIVLSAGVPTVSATPRSRAVIENGKGTVFTAGVAGWETAGAVDYTADAWYTTADITASMTAQPVALAAPQVYHADDNIKTYMKAWYPVGAPAKGKVTFSNPDGTVDALLAGEVVGSKNDNTGKVLNFAHKTTQLKFKVVADVSLAAGTTVNKITVLNAELPNGFDLTDGTATYGQPAPLDVPGLTTPVEITATATDAGQPVMIKPMTGNTVSLDIETSTATFNGVTAIIDDDTDFKEGKAYTITLTFKQQSLSLTATVAEWETGTGSADVE